MHCLPERIVGHLALSVILDKPSGADRGPSGECETRKPPRKRWRYQRNDSHLCIGLVTWCVRFGLTEV
jgi:hypothetical protein